MAPSNWTAIIAFMNDMLPRPAEESAFSVRLAWRRYLQETRGASFEAYTLVEELAWRRLAKELGTLGDAAARESDQCCEPPVKRSD
ncbi:MAG TPA: hypothetical protein VEH52_13000 [Gaiellaceae bacterium]|nr:hypothetical protein [Gaiellaceae bacterium]